MTDERRASARHQTSLAGELESDHGKSAIAITRDVSAGGLLVFTRMRLEIGTAVKIMVLFKDEKLSFPGTVLREQSLTPHESTLWRSKVAIAVEPTDPGLAKLYAAITSVDQPG